ncbi:septal ring lytic transglycosylase RlpA family protein [Desulfovibrio sp. OttesenSCG-928-G15]|nr:septal ring lytic transglycosylase RlpA family protein [Desulfovibrio sp. OttesenSCG-928-G15]
MKINAVSSLWSGFGLLRPMQGEGLCTTPGRKALFGSRKSTLALLLVASLLFIGTSAAQAKQKTAASAKKQAAASAKKQPALAGGASWYGHTFHGRITANGETYNQYAMTAAHKTLPFGVVIDVQNTRNGKHTLLRVNDRGPYIHGRVVDVSYRGARALGMTHSGVAQVRISVVSNKKGEPLAKGHAFFVHVADEASAASAKERADALAKKTRKPVRVIPSGGRFAVCLGPYAAFPAAQTQLLALEGNTMTAEKRRVRNPNHNQSTYPILGILEAPATVGQGVTAPDAHNYDADCGQKTLTERAFCTMQKRMAKMRGDTR